jgi:hypothetical protein
MARWRSRTERGEALNTFRILSIDGGGIKGVFPAAFLCALQEDLGVDVARHFDLIAGTSTGGIIALGLGLGLPPSQIVDFYIEQGPAIFTRRKPLWFMGPSKYNVEPLRNALEHIFGDRRLGESQSRLFIPSFDANSGVIHIYKTPHHERLRRDYRCTAVEVALATSAAPLYFPSHRSERDITLIDGGIWANNPTGLAVVEAMSMLGAHPGAIRVLSIGCTDTPANRIPGKWLGLWAFRLLDTILRGQSFGSMGIAMHLAGHENVFRYNPIVLPGRYKLDGVAGVDDLRGLAYQEARHASPKLREIFFKEPATPYVPMYSNASAVEPATDDERIRG